MGFPRCPGRILIDCICCQKIRNPKLFWRDMAVSSLHGSYPHMSSCDSSRFTCHHSHNDYHWILIQSLMYNNPASRSTWLCYSAFGQFISHFTLKHHIITAFLSFTVSTFRFPRFWFHIYATLEYHFPAWLPSICQTFGISTSFHNTHSLTSHFRNCVNHYSHIPLSLFLVSHFCCIDISVPIFTDFRLSRC